MTTTAPVDDADLALLVGVHRTLCEVRKANVGGINLRAEAFITREWQEAAYLVLGSISTVFREHAADPLFDVPTAIASTFEFCAQSYADSELTDEDLNRFTYTRMDTALYQRALEMRADARTEQ
jgi:hypothetical protein